MSLPFRTATAVVRVSEHEFTAQLPNHWQQGRGVFGGLIFGVLLRAARGFEADLTRVARTFSCDVAGPVVVGEARVHVQELRRGRNQTNLQLSLSQGAQVLASALCTLSTPRGGSAPKYEPAPPVEASQFEASRELPATLIRPECTRNYHYRSLGPLPREGAKEAIAMGFVREVAGEGELDAPALSALLDSWWPGIFAVSERPFPVSTISYNAQFMPDHALPAEEPLFYRARTLTQHDGYSVEFRELWTRERLVALNQQTFAVLG
ncbi:MAG TPA: thioesterase family protein [Polyangiales bacterium]